METNNELKNKLDNAMNELSELGEKLTFSGVLEKADISQMKMLNCTELSRYLIEEIKRRKKDPNNKKSKKVIPSSIIKKAVEALLSQDKEVSYENIASELNINIQHLYGNEDVKKTVLEHKTPRHMERLLQTEEQLKDILRSMLENNEIITVSEIAKRLDVSDAYIGKYHSLKDMVDTYKRKQAEKIKNENPELKDINIDKGDLWDIKKLQIILSLFKAIDEMVETDEEITMSSVAQKAGVSKQLPLNYQEVREKIEKAKKIREKNVAKHVKEVFSEMKRSKEQINTKILAERAGVSRSLILENEKIVQEIEDYQAIYKEELYIAKAKESIKELKKEKQHVTVKAVAKSIGISNCQVYRYPKLIDYITSKKDSYTRKVE